jgi:hypothetical protein
VLTDARRKRRWSRKLQERRERRFLFFFQPRRRRYDALVSLRTHTRAKRMRIGAKVVGLARSDGQTDKGKAQPLISALLVRHSISTAATVGVYFYGLALLFVAMVAILEL